MPHQFAIGVKPGERASIGGLSYVALIPHAILEFDLHKDLFLVEYPEKDVLKKEWVSIKDLEERGVIKLSWRLNQRGQKVSLDNI